MTVLDNQRRTWVAVNALTMLLATSSALAADTTYGLSGNATVDADGYHRTFHVTLTVVAPGSSGHVTVHVRRDQYECSLTGIRTNDRIVLDGGQQCPQSIQGDGFTAELTGRLKLGEVTLGQHSMTLHTLFDVDGSVRFGWLPIPLKGTLDTVATGHDT